MIHTLQKSKNFLASSSETKLSPHAWLSVQSKGNNNILHNYKVTEFTIHDIQNVMLLTDGEVLHCE